MWLQSRPLFIIRRCSLRCLSECISSTNNQLNSVTSENKAASSVHTFDGDKHFECEPIRNKRSLKVAILGTPNAGKSTLINKIIGHPIFSVSKKVHTTRKRARAAVVRENTQILFVDTPGLVSSTEVKRHHLDENFVVDGLRAIDEAHFVGVVHDVSNTWTRGRLDEKILNILNKMKVHKRAFLILNKVDMVKKKDVLLGLIDTLTDNKKDENLPDESENSTDNYNKSRRKVISGWNKFEEVFLVSALSGDGVPEVLEFLIKEAEAGKWALPPGRVTDQKHHIILEELIRGRLLDELPKEVPYNQVIETEYFHANELGEIIAVVLIVCPLERHRKMMIAGNGRIIRKVATLAEADARDALRTHVRLRIQVVTREEVLGVGRHNTR